MGRVPLLGLGIGLAAAGAVLASGAHERRERWPEPTENPLEDGDEERNQTEREIWFEQIHRAPGGTDWRRVEAANGRDEILRRNGMKGAPPPASGAASWLERGSQNQAGRIRGARASTDGTAIYAGTDLGGIWRLDASGTWTPLGDNLYGGAHYVVALPPDTAGGPDVLLVATSSGVVHRSDDDGQTWTEPSGLPDLLSVANLVETSDGTHAVFLACSHPGGDAWIVRSLDGGKTFTTVYELGTFNGDVWTPRDGSSHRLYVVSDSGLLVSDDLGDHWNTIGDVGAGDNSAAITGSEAGAPTLWVIVDSHGLYRSDDGGETWGRIGGVSDWYGQLDASIVDPTIVAYGGVELHRSNDAGDNFDKVNRWDEYYGSPSNMLHADIFGLDVVPDGKGGELWLIGTDGGLYQSLDSIATVENLSLDGLRISQYYSTLTSSADSTHVAAGAQDQGYQITNDIDQKGADVWSFEQAVSGDYGHLSSADGTHAWVFSTYPGFVLVQEGETDPLLSYLDFPTSLLSSAWIPPVVADPDESDNFFFCGDRLWYYERSGADWNVSQWSDEDFQSQQGEYLSALAFAPTDPHRAYGVTSRGRLFASNDHAVTWTATKSVQFFDYLYGATIAISPVNADIATIGGSGYGQPPVFRTEDGGQSWFDYSDGLPDTTVYAIAESLDGLGTLVAGTQTGAWRRDAGDASWWEIAAPPAPVTTYWSVEALAHERTFRFGTYGRGIWDYRLEASDACWPVVDEDGDGVGCDRDCNDKDAMVSPDVTENCDGVDTNCDSTDLDESDQDGDGEPACEDCDDTDPTDASCLPPKEQPSDGGGGEKAGGCSCATGAGSPASTIALLLLALLRRGRANRQPDPASSPRPPSEAEGQPTARSCFFSSPSSGGGGPTDSPILLLHLPLLRRGRCRAKRGGGGGAPAADPGRLSRGPR